jgi:uncharacterized membrane protein YkoI
MQRLAYLLVSGALIVAVAPSARAQASQDTVRQARRHTTTITTSNGDITYSGRYGYKLLAGGQPIYCHGNADSAEVAKVAITSNLYQSDMISADQAKALALCVAPGQIASGDMEKSGSHTVYEIHVLPDKKQTATTVEIDAYTGQVLNAKQFGGLRGLAAYLRESQKRHTNMDRMEDRKDSTSHR